MQRSQTNHSPQAQRGTRKMPKKRFVSTARGKAIVIIAGTLCFLVLFAAGFAFYFLSRINYMSLDKFGLSDTIPTDEVDSDIDPNLPVDNNPNAMQFGAGDIISDKNIQNILVIGTDTRGGSGYGRSDSMMLLSIDKKNNRLVMTSFLRDLYVKITGMQDNRINTAYGYGGPKLLIETIQNNFRIKIDNYVRIDFESFRDIIDAVGGIRVDLTSAEANELNSNPGRYADGGGKIQQVNTGSNTLNGSTALAYARIRKIDSDFGRTKRQRNVIQAVISKLKSSSVTTILGIVDKFAHQIQTDLSYGQITGLVFDSGTLMKYPITQLSIPVAGAYQNKYIRKMSVLVPDIEKNKAAIWALLYNK